jgi:hypothetical protein
LHKNLKYDTKNKQLVLNFFTPQSVFTGGWGTKFKCFRIFRASNHPKQSNLYSNNQIYIQTVRFEFKRTNQEVTHRYRPPALVTGSNAGAIYQAVATGPAPTRTLPPAPAGLKPYHPLSPPRHLLWALPFCAEHFCSSVTRCNKSKNKLTKLSKHSRKYFCKA